ncbi:uncharacterized protein HD556DRAFT_1305617 [Suillus plorans]|uniref:Uncharacterized protein n=1 Tax=Suillus plorans TaxID=116603 RepID=A0A9P7DP08_9AGAM|nr:uncharacterized protein HD556DRAFT_1305617 [Suillus plorans]KAG1799404.1 hypothetical protein HD556DRAFT_1305617 [Suillus plorans]
MLTTWLASTSWFNTVTNYPPAISFAINHNATGTLKDMTANLKNSQGFAMNIIKSAFSMECELYKSIDITHPVTGRGAVNLTKFKPVACTLELIDNTICAAERKALLNTTNKLHNAAGNVYYNDKCTGAVWEAYSTFNLTLKVIVLLMCAGHLRMVFMVLGMAWWSPDIDSACGLQLAWA